ncbi:MAG: Arm DNA-binding domain-containing protein [Pseudoxanthomonas sp.]
MVADGHGLALEVTPGGSKLWRFRYRWAGRPQMLALGAYPLVTLLTAREKRGEMRRQLSDGIDPGAGRLSRAARQEAHDDLLFGKVALDWLEERRTESAAKKTIQKMETIINGDLIPELGKESIGALKTPVVVEALKKINARAPHMAQKARTYVNQIILYAIQKGLRGKTEPNGRRAASSSCPTARRCRPPS